jgi:hypothetical protein
LILKNEKKNIKYDVYCFGLIVVEMISSDLNVPNAFKYLCRLINQGKLNEILSMIDDPIMQDFINHTLHVNPNDRWSVN